MSELQTVGDRSRAVSIPKEDSESDGTGVVLPLDQRFGYGTVRFFFGAEGRI